MRIGIDLGGTKIEAIALDDNGEQGMRHRVATPQGQYRETIDALVELVEVLEAEHGRAGSIGVGTPGAISSTSGLIKNANSVCLNGQALKTV